MEYYSECLVLIRRRNKGGLKVYSEKLSRLVLEYMDKAESLEEVELIADNMINTINEHLSYYRLATSGDALED